MDVKMQALFARLGKNTRTKFNGCGRCKWADLCADFIRLRGCHNNQITCKEVKKRCAENNVSHDDWVGFLNALSVGYYERPIPQWLLEKENIIQVQCKQCGETFDVMKGDEREYCSAECVRKAKSKAFVKRICPVCGKEFEFRYCARRKFCSKACLYQARRERMLIDNPQWKKGKAEE